ncbi:MAG TPA: hypothetical protein VFX16_36860 [Pseudonocardiaceae bacterium]|nr:hypothetical protein [Pseudonocardiaceae bacterium]
MRHRFVHGDDGAALVFVLLIVTVTAVLIGALMSMARTSLTATIGLRAQTGSAYSADGAMQVAINSIRNSTFDGNAGTFCFDNGTSATLTVPYGTGSAVVNCVPDPAKVKIQCPQLNQCNRPGAAVLTLGRVAHEDGLYIRQQGTGQFLVHGAIFSNSTINVDHGSLRTNAAVYARGTCTGTIVSNPAPASCNYADTTPPSTLGQDPGYLKLASSVPAYRSPPACTKSNSVVTFQPGYYDDAAALSSMMSGHSSCRDSTWWFKPGTYYFDFHNSGTNSDPALGGGSNVWQINDGYLVAGAPTDSTGKILSAPPNPVANIPGACDNPVNDPNGVGVQFIFGGDSQVLMTGGQAEICGSYSPTVPPVAVYGNTTGAETTTALTGTNGLKAATVTSAGGFTDGPVTAGPATTADLANIENTYAPGSYAGWTPNNANSQVGQVSVNGYAPGTVIPAGSNLVSAMLRVGHRFNPNGGTSESLSVQVTPNGGTTFAVPIPRYDATLPAGQTDVVDITSSLQSLVHSVGFSGATMSAQATISKKGTQDLDGVQLDLTYIAPAFRAESGCVTTTPYPGGSSCALLTAANGSGVPFYVEGTTYAPLGVVDLTLNNAAAWVFRFGIIVRALAVKETGSLVYSGPIIEVPDDSPGFVFNVFLSVYVCPGSTSCTVPQGPPTPIPALSARVGFVDTDPTTPVAGQRQVAILSWSSAR